MRPITAISCIPLFVLVILLAAPVPGCAAAPPDEPLTAPPGSAPTTAPALTAAQERAASLRPRLEAEGFALRAVEPFVVIGDEEPGIVDQRAALVAWAVRRLRAGFFDKDPSPPVDIWLFRDEASYRRNVRDRFGLDKPPTPYGWYDPERRVLIMNIETGGGTLVHEIVHPFVEANAPGCPAWINEGLGSLFEQCADREGRIVGLVNWRLIGLQNAMGRDGLPSIERLVTMTDADFYASREGDTYGQARYTMLWLQEHGRLGALWRGWLARRDEDPRGLASLRHAIGTDDLATWESEWRAWVMALRYE